MFTVALIGPDGAGKTTICRQLELSLPFRAKYLYMGVNLESSSLVLPTTRLLLELKRVAGKRPDMSGPPDPTRHRPLPKGAIKRSAAGLKSAIRLTHQLSEEWFRQFLIWFYVSRGYIVLSDRHFFADYYAHGIADMTVPRSMSSRFHGFMLDRFYPRPDLVICLDAPPEVLLARKGEGTIASLESRRREYKHLNEVVEHFYMVDATQPAEQVASRVKGLICDFHRMKTTAQYGARENHIACDQLWHPVSEAD